jgi:4-hydroxybenzoate polyprenyltransferase
VQDIEDDEIAGISSSARLFGSWLILAVGLCYVAAVLLMLPALYLAGAGVLGWLGLVLFAGHLARQALRLEARDGLGALTLFRSNRDAGLILFAGLAADSVWQGLIGV